MTKRVDKLINHIRKWTENQEFSDTEGITNDVILQCLNDGVHRLQSLIVAKHSKAFLTEKVVAVSPLIRAYEAPDNAFLGSKIYNVEISENGTEEDYFKLKLGSLHLKSTQDSTPCEYFTRDNKVILSPIPDSAMSMRLTYTKRVNTLDIRRGIITIATVSGNSITSLELDVNSATTPLDTDELNDCDYICIVDKRGTIKMRAIPISGINTSTGVISIDTFEFEDGESIAVGDYVVCGEDTSTHALQFPRTVERYLLSYGKWNVLKKDSSADYAEAQAELLAMEDDIVSSYAEEDLDILTIPDLGGSW